MGRTWIVALALACGFAGPAWGVGRLADVTLYDRAEHRTLPVYSHGGRYYVAGKPGNEYEIRVRNTSGNEILAVVSVDGINAISGETANWRQTGYVIGPYSSIDIKGWRKNLERVAAFFFTEHNNSYAARTGRPDNVGVIGVALFRKKPEPEVLIERDARRREAPGARSSAPSEMRPAPPERNAEKNLGTGHGRSEDSYAQYTAFERASSDPSEVIGIYYDSHQNLLAEGVIKAPQMVTPKTATPFPGQFVPDPQ